MRYTIERLIEELKKKPPKDWVDFQIGNWREDGSPSIRTNINRIDAHPGRVVVVVEKGF